MKFGVFSALLIAVTVSVAAVPAGHAAIIVDQDAFAPPPSGPPLTGRIATTIGNRPGGGSLQAGQTVTAGVAGRLDSIELQGFRSLQPDLIYNFTLYDGDLSAGGRIVGSVGGITPSGVAPPSTFINVSGIGYNLLPGQVFSFSIGVLSALPNASASLVVGNFAGAVPPAPPPILNFNNYAGGIRYLANTGGPFILQPNGDLGFRSYVETAVAGVPEPGSWAMMILGFGLIGGTARRRGRVLRIA